jgi:aryl-alcohol dehydrogenase-like predicted oxidoreductase
MEQLEFAKSGLMTSRIGLGTWAMGGWRSVQSRQMYCPTPWVEDLLS